MNPDPCAPAGVHVACMQCPVRALCFLPADGGRKPPPAQVVIEQQALPAGSTVQELAPAGAALEVVRRGTLKSVMRLADGREEITAFHLPGEVLGVESLARRRPKASAVALDEAQVCVVPYEPLMSAAALDGRLRQRLWTAVGEELTRRRRTIEILSTHPAGARVAAFLQDIAHRMQERGYPPQMFPLGMTLAEIASYLSLPRDVLAEELDRLARQGALRLERQHVLVPHPGRLQRLGQGVSA